MWTNENRGRYNRSRLRYLSDMTNEESVPNEPLLPSAKRGGNKRTVVLRQVANGSWMPLLVRFAHDRNAAVAITVALMAPLLLSFAALAVDVPYWYGTHEILQTAVDAAAMSAALTGVDGDGTQILAAAAADNATGQQFNFQHPSGGTVFTMTETSGPSPGSTLYTATASVPLAAFFSSIVTGGAGPEVFVSATAIRQPQQTSCVLSLNNTENSAIATNGGGTISAVGCGIFSNSDAGEYAISSGYNSINAKNVGAVGGISGMSPGQNISQNALPEADPLAKMGTPPAFLTDSTSCQKASGSQMFMSGTCFNGGLKITGKNVVTFGPGIYYFINGNLDISGGAQIIVNGATLVFEDGAGFKIAGGASSMNMAAPSENCVSPSDYPALDTQASLVGGICGVLIYQARNDTEPDMLSGGGTLNAVSGIIYTPNASLSINGNGVFAASAGPNGAPGTLSVVADTISVSGTAELDASAPTPNNTSNVSYLVQ